MTVPIARDVGSVEAAGRRLFRPSLQILPKRFRRITANLALFTGLAVLILIVFIAIFAPLLATADPYAQDVSRRMLPPIWHTKGSWEHVLGTDQLGRDYYSRLIYGARISLAIGFGTAIASGAIGITLGALAGYFGGWFDEMISFFVSVRLAIPVILVALSVAALAGSSLTIVIATLGLLLWDRFAVVTRSLFLQLREQEYVAAAHAIGFSTSWIIFREILPNARNALIVVATLEMAHAILLEAALSFLGLGVLPPAPSWGLMISEGKKFMFFSPWVIALPGTALFILVLAINLFGDGLRDMSELKARAD
ncbi:MULTISPECIES: ABC transporter permease [unclassified Chelatococcus]|uniref:ABC transporter permease n=1 Tax=unclassified Chelatococcus TaxID=2638111 RepID=UPI001BCCE693|nr:MULTISPECIES: ABC transporter permease [unclassified Chelatococcus]MBS7700264.1 ABC transporter permease [Chelatococcus sp. YT9]MBX3558235.1 ABC transporter permease [Chelatococcus sp.]